MEVVLNNPLPLLVLLLGLFGRTKSHPSSPVVDTHVHNANISAFSYTFPGTFPQLNRSWTISDYTNATTATTNVRGIILMEVRAHERAT